MRDLLSPIMEEFRKELYEKDYILETTNKYQVAHRIDKTLKRILLEREITPDIIEYTVSDPDEDSVWYGGEYLNNNENSSYILIKFIDHLRLMNEFMLLKIEKGEEES